ncbi:MAG: fumarate hydratase C-terminal domain-containing protein [Candidatus Aenigmarchaeota archaeon]|nr:fumarate hydratase C-terminal domain-containing protein [Candidatus Aenigmarchaeota archaeon]
MDIDFTKLKVGDKVVLNGTIFTARDRAHLFLLKNEFPQIQNSIIYHCGPIVKDDKIIAAGPTSSARMDAYTPKLIDKYNIKAIIGKGGMDDNVLKKLKGRAVYLSAIGGAALIYSKNMKIKNVYCKEFGMTEAIWEIEVENFPVIVTMDSNGNSLHSEVLEKSRNVFQKIVK